jgi:hypothetical protein
MRIFMLAFAVAVTVSVAFLSTLSRTPEDSCKTGSDKSHSGSADEAFDMSCRVIKEFLSTLELSPVSFDPQYRATLLSPSRIWTIKGYASCQGTNKSYRWTVIMSLNVGQEWEVLEKIVTPGFTAPNGTTDGVPQFQGKLIPSDSIDSR